MNLSLITKTLVRHDILHAKYATFFKLTLASLVITMLMRFILDIILLSGGSIAVIGIISAVIVFICEGLIVVTIFNIAFDANWVFTYTATDLENQLNGGEDDNSLLMQEI